jgi:hypothetical protein
MRYQVPNPANPRQLRPVDLITDRAKRYRANASPPAGPRICNFCSAAKARDIDHIDGDESNGDPSNLQYLCRTCNASKAAVQANAGEGKRTAQYNPSFKPTFRQYVDAVLVLRGDHPGNAAKAARVLQATTPARREDFRHRITAARNPEPSSPSYPQYAYAVAIHQRGAHDEGGKIIHATPAADRSKYARQFAASKRKKSRMTSRGDVPF